MTTLVQARLLPEGDPKQQLQTLQQGVLQQFIWIRQHDAKGLPVDKETYKRFMGILLSSLYVFSPQGRCQGIEDLKLGQADDLIHNGFIQTTKFKTQARWGFQPVTLSEESKELMTIYLRTFRPVAAGPIPSQPTCFTSELCGSASLRHRKGSDQFLRELLQPPHHPNQNPIHCRDSS